MKQTFYKGLMINIRDFLTGKILMKVLDQKVSSQFYRRVSILQTMQDSEVFFWR